MLTKKQLIERLKDVPDDALIGGIPSKYGGVVYDCVWETGREGEIRIHTNIMQDAKILPLSNRFSIEDYK